MIRRKRSLCFETHEDRLLMASDVGRLLPDQFVGNACFAVPHSSGEKIQIRAVGSEPQYRVHQQPRIQLGNAPLSGSATFVDSDQIQILWQTVPDGAGSDDSFLVEWRSAEVPDSAWQNVNGIDSLATGVEGRIIHSATLTDLEWHHRYEYRVSHMRASTAIEQYQATFQTRLQPGDTTPFSFAAYGDSASLDSIEYFRAVQLRINQSAAEFAVLAGDNIYPNGSHTQADARFVANVNPEAAFWTASHVDYIAIGNHDVDTANGQANADSYAMPIPHAGVNAFANAPVGEVAEFYSSFDYGNVHFVTIDSNRMEDRNDAMVEQQAEFLRTNLAASQAQWNVVYMHHPLFGSRKFDPNSIFGYGTHYLETIGEVLIEQDVDLVLVGDSHAYAWSYPVTGFADNNADGKINLDEIQVDSTSDFDFVKGDGFVQTIVGVAGRNLRDDITYPHPALASTYSTVASNGTNRAFPSEFGFAQIHVSDQELVVQYISAESGHIVGDTNGNGVREAGEAAFAEFRIVDPSTSINIDLNDDGVVDALDIDTLCAAIWRNEQDNLFDLNDDNEVNRDDYDFMLNDLMNVQPGDANLDGVFNSADLVLVFQAGRFENDLLSAGWQQGDWNCDGKFGSSDLVLVFALGLYQP